MLKKYISHKALVAMLVLCFVIPVVAREEVRINFRDADIRSVIESVAEITGKSFVLDPRVKGKVTIIAPQPIDAGLVYESVLSAIQVQGFQAVEDGAVIRIIPFSQAFNFAGGSEGNQMRTEVIEIKHVQAATLVSVLKPMLSNGARLMAYPPSNYLVVSDIATNIEQLKDFVSIMDDPDSAAVEVINLTHISAAEAVHIASQLKQLQKQELSLVEDSLNNRVILSGPGIARSAFKAMLRSLDVPPAKQGGVEVIYLDYLRASEIKPVLEGMLGSDTFLRLAGQSGSAESKDTTYKIEVDELNNALVLAAPRQVILEVKNVVGQLDLPRPQVLIEAVIAELSEGQAKKLSSQLVYTSRNRGAYLTNFDGVLTGLLGAALSDNTGVSSSAIAAGAIPNTVLGAVGEFNEVTGKGMGLLVQALQTDGATKILSTPSVVTLDNEEASLSVGEEVPFQTGSYTNNSTGNLNSNPFTTINREEVGVILKVKPQISKGDAVRLEIEQESSKVNEGGVVGLQTTSKATMKTNVMVQDGELLVLGGLIEDAGSDASARLPILGDIPLLGRLFRSTDKSASQSVTMMFIRPTIIRSAIDGRSVTRGRFDHLIKRDLNEGKNPGFLAPKLRSFLSEQSDDPKEREDITLWQDGLSDEYDSDSFK